MHLNIHRPEYFLTWQFGLSCVKWLMEFQLKGKKKKKEYKKNKQAKPAMLIVKHTELLLV